MSDHINAASVERDFRAELHALLTKWDAEINADDHWPGYAECGQDIRMTVSIPGIYDGENTRESADFDLGSYVSPRISP